jgi:hypothetical protein
MPRLRAHNRPVADAATRSSTTPGTGGSRELTVTSRSRTRRQSNTTKAGSQFPSLPWSEEKRANWKLYLDRVNR